MNAYELADELDRVLQVSGCDNRVPRMLRQQAEKISNMEIWEKKYLDRIEELEKEKIRAYDNGFEDGQKSLTSNYKYDPDTGEPLIDGYPLFSGLPPPQIKELSDAEISEISHRYHYTYNPDYVGFARAILKKASEK